MKAFDLHRIAFDKVHVDFLGEVALRTDTQDSFRTKLDTGDPCLRQIIPEAVSI